MGVVQGRGCCAWRAPRLRPRPPSPAPQAAPWAGGWGLELSAPPRTPTSQQSATAGLAVLGDARLASGREASSRRPSSGRRAPPSPPASRAGREGARGRLCARPAGGALPPPRAPGPVRPARPLPALTQAKMLGAQGLQFPGHAAWGHLHVLCIYLHIILLMSAEMPQAAAPASLPTPLFPDCSPRPSSLPPTHFVSFLKVLCGESDAFAW